MRIVGILILIIFVASVWWVAVVRDRSVDVQRIAAAARSEWQGAELYDWAERLGCEQDIVPIASGDRVHPIVEKIIECAERRLKTCGR